MIKNKVHVKTKCCSTELIKKQLKNKPNVGNPIAKKLPGQIFNRNEQCKRINRSYISDKVKKIFFSIFPKNLVSLFNFFRTNNMIVSSSIVKYALLTCGLYLVVNSIQEYILPKDLHVEQEK